MNQKILLSSAELHAVHASRKHLVVDCRFAIDDPDAGYEAYQQSHIPGAVYAHLDNELSSPITRNSGRHPLPDGEKFAVFLSELGWQAGMVMVVYDNMGGAIAARLWWLMKYFGHAGTAMLDGGLPAWVAAGYGLESGKARIDPSPVSSYARRRELAMSADAVAEGLQTDSIILADARAPERFNGDVEPLDRLPGHIPGAVNYPFNKNLGPNGLFKPAEDIRSAMHDLLGDNDAGQLVYMCGSGVTACHNIFAAELAGIEGCTLYAGSWSEWIQDPSRPIAF